MTGGLSIWGLFYHRFWNRLGTFKLPSKGVKMHACSWSIWYTEEVRNGLLRPLRFRKPESYPIFYIDIDMYIYIYMSPGSDLTLSIVRGWLARASGSEQTAGIESENSGYIMNVCI